MKQTSSRLTRVFPFLLVIGGAIGLFASFMLSYDTFKIAQNSHYVPSCNLNPIISCGDVINATGDKILGLPYPYYGIAAFGVVLTVGVMILAGAQVKRWFWQVFQVVASLGLIGAYALLLKSMFKIHALCPYCLSVDVVVTTLVWYLTLYNIDNHNFTTKNKTARTIYRWVRKHHLDLLLLWFLIIILFILHHFWYFYGKYF